MIFNSSIIFLPHERVVSEEDIKNFEKAIGFELPTEYFQFIKEINGGKFQALEHLKTDGDLMFKVPNFEERGEYIFDVSSFNSLSNDPNDYDILQRYRVMTEDWGVPKSLLVFATTAGNLKIFLGLDGDTKGRVLIGGDKYVEKFELEQTIEPGDFVCIAPTFLEFMNQLYWVPWD